LPNDKPLISVRSLLDKRTGGRYRIKDVLLCPSPPRICCFQAKVGRFILSKTVFLDARAALVRGDSLIVRDVFLEDAPDNSFSCSSQAWLLDPEGNRFGDIIDALVARDLRVREFIVKLNHELVLPEDNDSVSKEARKEFMKSMPDATALGGGAYTVASLPVSRVEKIENDPLFYEVTTGMLVTELRDSVARDLASGKREKGMLRDIFRELAGQDAR
jgi:hypothetical protein